MDYLVPGWAVTGHLIFVGVLIAAVFLLLFKIIRNWLGDYGIIIDKGNRFDIIRGKFSHQDKIEYGDSDYFLKDEAILRNRRGRVLAVWSSGRPAPMKLSYNSSEWLSGSSIRASLNNEAIQKIVRPANPGKEVILLLGAIGGIIAGISAVLILLITTGVLNLK